MKKKNTEALFVASMNIGVEVNAKTSKTCFNIPPSAPLP